ncbi:lasso peptide biosynthesis PqqD family chaperone [Saccharothrix australiensis]|uniref:Coenzyme PQQ synthesis protein D (PqqD) n=1 Tax=Saccharothrix australiensis TaxID=2072 RepID=A0A495VZG5_9PSEU|nr:lasso peptide biosynthesis PqqD family chaperone [Saccharothrix australiensis]RKT54599.1 coenzyme PQQ synthesis protein D (PqqD) [Saccharothrix australiensis]
MSTPYAPPERVRLAPRTRLSALAAVAVAAPLTRLPPKVLRAVLALASRGARAATAAQASAAREAVVASSLRCAVNGCLQRSIATALLCRARGTWPTWRLGARTTPFGAHAWVEAEGRMIDEPLPDGYYVPLITVGPPTPGSTCRERTAGILRLHHDALSAETDDGAVLLNQRTGDYWQLNHTGVDTLRRLLSGQTPDDAAEHYAAHYDIDPALAHRDILAMTDRLLDAGFLTRT